MLETPLPRAVLLEGRLAHFATCHSLHFFLNQSTFKGLLRQAAHQVRFLNSLLCLDITAPRFGKTIFLSFRGATSRLSRRFLLVQFNHPLANQLQLLLELIVLSLQIIEQALVVGLAHVHASLHVRYTAQALLLAHSRRAQLHLQLPHLQCHDLPLLH